MLWIWTYLRKLKPNPYPNPDPELGEIMAALDKLSTDIAAAKAANDRALNSVANLKLRLTDRLVDPAQVAALDNAVLTEVARSNALAADLDTIAPAPAAP